MHPNVRIEVTDHLTNTAVSLSLHKQNCVNWGEIKGIKFLNFLKNYNLFVSTSTSVLLLHS